MRYLADALVVVAEHPIATAVLSIAAVVMILIIALYRGSLADVPPEPIPARTSHVEPITGEFWYIGRHAAPEPPAAEPTVERPAMAGAVR